MKNHQTCISYVFCLFFSFIFLLPFHFRHLRPIGSGAFCLCDSHKRWQLKSSSFFLNVIKLLVCINILIRWHRSMLSVEYSHASFCLFFFFSLALLFPIWLILFGKNQLRLSWIFGIIFKTNKYSVEYSILTSVAFNFLSLVINLLHFSPMQKRAKDKVRERARDETGSPCKW